MKKSSKISKRIAELISTASVRQRALVLISEWRDRNEGRETPLLTKEEADAILDSFKTNGERKEYNKYLRLYNIMAEHAQTFGLAEALFRGEANELVGYLRQLETLYAEENHLNTIYQAILDSKSREALEAFNTAIEHIRFNFAKVTRDKEGYIEIDTSKLWEIIEDKAEDVKAIYSTYKTLVEVTQEWIKRKKASAFIPDVMKESFGRVKEDYALQVAPRYSRKELAKKEARNVHISPSERRRAIFPYYEEIPIKEDEAEYWRNRIRYIESNNE